MSSQPCSSRDAPALLVDNFSLQPGQLIERLLPRTSPGQAGSPTPTVISIQSAGPSVISTATVVPRAVTTPSVMSTATDINELISVATVHEMSLGVVPKAVAKAVGAIEDEITRHANPINPAVAHRIPGMGNSQSMSESLAISKREETVRLQKAYGITWTCYTEAFKTGIG